MMIVFVSNSRFFWYPYVLMSYVYPTGGTNPFFNEEEVEFWIGKQDWGAPLVFSCLDEDVGSDDLIGGEYALSYLMALCIPSLTLLRIIENDDL